MARFFQGWDTEDSADMCCDSPRGRCLAVPEVRLTLVHERAPVFLAFPITHILNAVLTGAEIDMWHLKRMRTHAWTYSPVIRVTLGGPFILEIFKAFQKLLFWNCNQSQTMYPRRGSYVLELRIFQLEGNLVQPFNFPMKFQGWERPGWLTLSRPPEAELRLGPQGWRANTL